MPKLSKNIFLFILLLTLFFSFKINKSFAQSHPQSLLEDTSIQKYIDDQNKCYEKAKADGSPCIYNGAVTRQQQAVDLFAATEKIVRINPNPEIALNNKPALETLTAFMGTLYANPPASSILYAYDILSNAGLVKSAYAQGIGFAGLSPFLPYWKASRNLAYSAIIIIMIAIGFMVIFRMKIDPKTVISVQAAIPKIVITLILITLSYPIAGFMIDLMYLVMSISISMIVQAAGGQIYGANIINLQSKYLTSDVFDLMGAVIIWPIGPILKGFFSVFATVGVGSGLITAILPATIASSGLILPIALGIPALLLFIIALGLLFTFIRLALLLLNSYIQLLIGVILGPIFLLMEAIPGRSAFSQWLLNIIANLVVFPATAIIILFAVFIMTTKQGDGSWAPPFIGIGGSNNLFSSFLGLGIIYLAPTLVAQIKKQFHPKPALPVTAGTAFAPITGGAQTAMGAASQFYYLQQMPVIGRYLGGGQGQHK